MEHSEPSGIRAFLFSRSGLVLALFLAVAGYFLWTEHEAHIRAAVPLPYLLLLACPLMHLFMHHGHGGHRGHRRHSGKDRKDGGSHRFRDEDGSAT